MRQIETPMGYCKVLLVALIQGEQYRSVCGDLKANFLFPNSADLRFLHGTPLSGVRFPEQ